MKASDLQKDGSELQHKVRSVSDLIRHIKTRETDSETPNYNLFFGAGCSVSSGIRPAGKLIEEWVNDLYERFNSKPPESTHEAKLYFENKQSNWYNKDNAYSSLFEKTYEFASQRRRFVEREVDKALPAIGYAYLTSLVSKKYFNTIFTTNFDDLINEAFYQFSNDRPLLCAHDSSIKSISITSKRPKIIKLHGDYLFDDIKSTLRETESLEQNTKEKLIEFCKEFGLIVIGYSGNDRSIMEVIDFLTKQESYLKNGVYWCLRKDDYINHNLQNLFWKEKAYPVIIDGFDELFAEIHTKLMGGGLDFEVNIKNSKLQQIKKNILDERNPLNKNKYIQNDIRSIKDTSNKQDISDFLSDLTNSGESEDLSLIDLRNLLEIKDLIKKKEYEKAYKLAEDFYYHSVEVRDKSRYISMLISISDSKGEQRKSLEWCDKLIDLDPNNNSYIIKRSHYLSDLDAKYSYLIDKSNKYNCRYKLYNASAIAGCTLIKNDPLNTGIDENILISHLDKSLILNPSLSNRAWLIKYDILNRIKNKPHNTPEYLKKISTKINEIIESALNINNKNLVTFELRINKSIADEDFDNSKTIITDLYKLHDETDASGRIYINEHLNELIKSFTNYNNLINHKTISSDFYEKHLTDKIIKNNPTLLLSKSRYFISSKNEIGKSTSYFISALECQDVIFNFQLSISLNNCLEHKYTGKLLELLEENKSKLLERYYYEYKHMLYIQKNDYLQAVEFLEKSFSWGLPMKSYFESLSYLFVLAEEYEKLINLETCNREKIECLESNSFTINYQFALKKTDDNEYDPVCLRNLIAKTNDPSLRLAAFAVLGQETDVKRVLSEEIEISYTNYYTYKNWPIIKKDILEEVAKKEAA